MTILADPMDRALELACEAAFRSAEEEGYFEELDKYIITANPGHPDLDKLLPWRVKKSPAAQVQASGGCRCTPWHSMLRRPPTPLSHPLPTAVCGQRQRQLYPMHLEEATRLKATLRATPT